MLWLPPPKLLPLWLHLRLSLRLRQPRRQRLVRWLAVPVVVLAPALVLAVCPPWCQRSMKATSCGFVSSAGTTIW